MTNNYAVGMINPKEEFYGDRLILLDELDKATAKSIARAKNKRNPKYYYFLIDWDSEADEFDEFFVGRGGSVTNNAEQCRIVYRHPFNPYESYNYLGLRLALSETDVK